MNPAGVDIVADSLSASGRFGAAFENVSVDLPAGSLAAVVGADGSGRTELLLALCGRLRLTTGRLAIGGHRAPDERAARRLVVPARVPPATDLEPRLRVRHLVAETRIAAGRAFDDGALSDAFDLAGLDLSETVIVGALRPDEITLLALCLAAAQLPGGIVIDAVDAGATAAEAREIWRVLGRFADAGFTLVAGALNPPPTMEWEIGPVTVIEIPHPRTRLDDFHRSRTPADAPDEDGGER